MNYKNQPAENTSAGCRIKSFLKKIKEAVPLYAYICAAIFLASAIIYLIMKQNVAFADFLNGTVSHGIRSVLALISSVVPFSIIEMLLIISPVLVILMIFLAVRAAKRSPGHTVRFVCAVLSVAFVVLSVFFIGYEPSFYGTSIEKNTGIARNKLSAEDLRDASVILQELAERELDSVWFVGSGASVCPYKFSELNDKMLDAYDAFCEKYGAYNNMSSKFKPVILSEPWTYTHISGMYSFITGEANINVNYPDFIMVTTVAHEMAHQRGIGKEDEADFTSFLVCTESDDPYIRYCGYVEMYRMVVGKLYGANKDYWTEVKRDEDKRITAELSAFSSFFDKYRENVAAKVSDTVNNAFIQSHNQPAGVKSYGLVTDLAVNYLLDKE